MGCSNTSYRSRTPASLTQVKTNTTIKNDSNNKRQPIPLTSHSDNKNSKNKNDASQTSIKTDISSRNANVGNENYYVVKPGDNLYAIAFSHNKELKLIALINNIDSSYRIHPGQKILLDETKSNLKLHRVRKDDTVYNLSKRYGITQEELRSLNGIQANSCITIGQTLIVGVNQPKNSNISNNTQIKELDVKQDLKNNNVIIENAVSGSAPALSEKKQTENAHQPIKPNTVPRTTPVISSNNSTSKQVSDKQNNTNSKQSNLTVPQKPTTTVSVKPSVTSRNSDNQKAKTTNKISWKWPHNGSVIEKFSNSSKGISISGKKGSYVTAAAPGKIVYAGNALRGYGNLIIINHDDDYLSAYAHNDAILVQEGSVVKQGQRIAKMGDTDAKVVSLHFEIRYQGQSVDPLKFLPKK